MKYWNVGVSAVDGRNLGFIVRADCADAGLAIARAECARLDIALIGGGMTQVRSDRTIENRFFENSYDVRWTPL